METICPEKSTPLALLTAYRAAVSDLIASLLDHDLTSTHLARIGRLTPEGASSFEAVQRELRKRLARFERIEPERWAKECALL
jgi:hypothetical protein